VVLASYRRPLTWATLGWVVLAFTAARFAAMGFNRVADREFDARNPRTRLRELPRGAMTVREATASVALASGVFVLAAAMLNRLCLALSPLALGWVFFYSYTKRFTRFAHLALGLGMAIAPVGGYLAVAGRWSQPWWMLCALATAVLTWGAGFDVLYALPDIAFDRANGLYSIPSTVGESKAIGIARALHATTVLMLALVGSVALAGFSQATMLYWLGVIGVAMLLVYEHSLVKPGELSRLDAAFFTMNGVISLLFFGFVLAGRFLSRVSYDLAFVLTR
jgi:4-hydroxybenzoate polyprenyltransferase